MKRSVRNIMLVDLARNDMGRIAEFGSVKVTEFMNVQNYSHVMHIVSMVEGRKRNLSSTGSGSVFPAVRREREVEHLKIRAMEIIDELEDNKRGLYGGATGIDFNGDMDCITIRTMIKKGKGLSSGRSRNRSRFRTPKEYEECCNKVMALAKTLVNSVQ